MELGELEHTIFQLLDSVLQCASSARRTLTARSWRLGDAWLPAECLRFLHVGFGDDEMLDAGTQSSTKLTHLASMQEQSSYKDPAMGLWVRLQKLDRTLGAASIQPDVSFCRHNGS